MLTSEDNALWEAYAKTVTPLGAASRLKVIGQRLANTFRFRRKEKLFVPDILDLHGFTVQEAYALFVRFLNYHVQNGTKRIVVITGKGKDDKGVLKLEFPKWLENPTLKENVAKVALPESYGGGAFELMLKQRKK